MEAAVGVRLTPINNAENSTGGATDGVDSDRAEVMARGDQGIRSVARRRVGSRGDPRDIRLSSDKPQFWSHTEYLEWIWKAVVTGTEVAGALAEMAGSAAEGYTSQETGPTNPHESCSPVVGIGIKAHSLQELGDPPVSIN
ncbi:hypothetical protein NDU88_001133 [Pleurodeles waltl]|uniref:Uncharacterized protein n=1 Tax=Pleurodeles waltl TaxID=8319 RepID=A0AAV7MMV5_PLEWA|nr:hypothetical protein NDU88_001133 [Pleurodeles waltl]